VEFWSSYEARARVGKWLLAALVPLSVLLVGSIHTAALAPMLLLAATSSALLTIGHPSLALRKGASLLVLMSAALTAYTLFQRLPVPMFLLRFLSPNAYETWLDAVRPLREVGPRFASFSLDPRATTVEVARGLLYVNVLLSGLVVARKTEGTLFLERVLLVSSCFFAVVALVHPAIGTPGVFGLYTPETAFERRVGPLLNSNHLGGYITLGICLATGILLSSRAAFPKVIVGAVSVLLVGAQVFVASRGAFGTSLLGVALVPLIAQRKKSRRQNVGALVVLLTVLASVVAIILAQSESTNDELSSKDLSKFDLFAQAIKLCKSFPLFGIGRGAFESVFPKERLTGGNFVFTHPENIVIQWFTEWGIPISVAAFAAIAWALKPKTVTSRSHPPIGAYVAICAVGLQNLVDFSSEVPGVMVALVLCAAMVCAGSRSSTQDEGVRRIDQRPYALLAVSCVAALWVFVARSGELSEDQAEIRKLASDSNISREFFHTNIRSAMLRHPAAPYLPFLGAYRATQQGDEAVLPWVNRALERSPIYGRAHLLLGHSLARISRSQARLEYRLGLEQDDGTLASFIEEVPLLVGSYDDALELMPVRSPESGNTASNAAGLVDRVESTRQQVTDALVAKVSERLPATAERLDQYLLASHAKSQGALERKSEHMLRDLTWPAPWCDKNAEGTASACDTAALEAAKTLRTALPLLCSGHRYVAEVGVARGNAITALSELSVAAETVTDPAECFKALASLAARAKEKAALTQALDKLIELPCDSPEACSLNLVFASRIEAERKNPRRALTLIRKACELNPARLDLLIEQANLAKSLSLFSEAAEVFETLSLKNPGEPKWIAERDACKHSAKLRTLKLPTDLP
jgi:tetratricopeptide (TPR) repeat protein